MARIVKVEDQTPLIIRPEELNGRPCAVCRCGLSGQWPMCDGTHKATRDEEPGKLYHYTRELPQGNVTREEVGELEWPGGRRGGKVAPPAEHEGDGSHRGRRPAPEQAKHTSKGNAAGSEPEAGEGDATSGGQDELLESGGSAASALQPKTAHGGREGLAPKNRSGQGGESA